MRFRKVVACGFGPHTNDCLELAPRMTVVYGLNEAGKSSWHAALYAGFCGMRRGAGKRSEDRAFAERHRPWDGCGWHAGVVVELADGRIIELRQDLERLVSSSVIELGLGRDCANEILKEGSPDGSHWLGLDRRSFLATACVRQAELLEVLGDPSCLQRHLERAAATAGTDATAAAALEAIQEFHSEHVGLNRANSTKPLRRALSRRDTAEAALDEARREHDAYLDLVARRDDLERAAQQTRHRVRVLQAAHARAEARAWLERFERAREIVASHPEPPATFVEDHAVAAEVAGAIEAWESSRDAAQLVGPTPREIEEKLEALPASPQGDVEPDPAVITARDDLRLAQHEFERHRAHQPPQPLAIEVAADEHELLLLARELIVELPPVAPDLERRLRDPKTRARSRGARVSAKWLAAACAVVAGVAAAIAGHAAPGVLLIAAGMVLGGVSAWRAGRQLGGASERRAAQEGPERTLEARRAAEARRHEAIQRARELGLTPDAAAITRVANDIASAALQRREHERWLERFEVLENQRERAQADLRNALMARGVEVGEDALEAARRYEEECRSRARLAREAARRADLERELQTQKRAEALVKEDLERRAKAAHRVRDIARRCGVEAQDPDVSVAALGAWQQRRSEQLHERERALQAYNRLAQLLDGRTLDELGGFARERWEAAGRLSSGLDSVEIDRVARRGDLASELERERERLEQTSAEAATCRGEVTQQSKTLPNVAAAEEELAAARRELERINRLDTTLQRTREFLQRAEDRVHRDMAPRLGKSISEWLPAVTQGRYTDAVVDPQTLVVKVRDAQGRLREATRLSHGTAEQVYLLLRIALVEHLTAPDEVCPLILDEVTVQCDVQRTRSVLGLLHDVSRTRQVILFTQEPEVLEWAERNLAGEGDKLVQLDRRQQPRADHVVRIDSIDDERRPALVPPRQ